MGHNEPYLSVARGRMGRWGAESKAGITAQHGHEHTKQATGMDKLEPCVWEFREIWFHSTHTDPSF